MRVPQPLIRPLAESDLAPVPDGWRTGPPDFVGVGTPKAGTTWWWSMLAQHPGFVPNRARVKELYAFHHLGWRLPGPEDAARYQALFARPPGHRTGEWTPSLLAHPLAIEALHAAAPGTRVLVALRNPIDRFVSLLNQHLGVRAELIGAQGDGRRVLEVHSLFPGAAHFCRVASDLGRLLELFGPDRVSVRQYERMKLDPLGEMAQTYRFVGLDDSFRPERPELKVNHRAYRVERPTPGERARLARFYADEVRSLFALDSEYGLDLDLDLWSDFAPAKRAFAAP